MKAAGGDRYDGEYKDGMRDGKGVYITGNGERYEGTYKNNQRDGPGVLTDSNGHRVEGVFQSGVLVSKQSRTAAINSTPIPPLGSPSTMVSASNAAPAPLKEFNAATAASGTSFRIIDCKGGYQGVAGLPPKTFDLRKSTPSDTYPRAQVTGGIFPIIREAVEFFQSACKQTSDYVPNTIWLFDNVLPTPETITTAKNDSMHYVWITHSNTSWSVKNGPADAAKKEQEQQRQALAEQEKSKQVAALRSQEANRRAAFLAKYGAVEIPKMGILRSNPFSLEGKTIAIPVNFYQMTSPTVGRFEVLRYSMDDRGGQIIVSNVPKGTFSEPTRAFLAAKVLGLTPIQGGEGGDPHLAFVGVVTCPESNSSCP